MKIKTVAESFQNYRNQVLPREASAVQVEECRRAFFGGAYILLMTVAYGIGDDSTSEDEGVVALETLKAECEAFAAAVALTPTPAAPPEPADINYTIPDPHEIRSLLQEIGGKLGSMCPEGWGFNLLIFEFGDGPGKGLFYISNAQRADVLATMREFIRRQTQ